MTTPTTSRQASDHQQEDGTGWVSLIAPTCTACGTAAAEPDVFYYLWRARRFTIFRCRFCTHQFVYPSVTAEDQARIYSDGYFAAGGDWAVGHFGGTAYADTESALRREARAVHAGFRHIAPAGRLLDIGCAGGVFLDEMQRAGYEVAGIELNATMAERARTQFGLTVTTGEITEVAPTGQFDVITLLDVLEHVPEPLAALRKVFQWLTPGGCVVIRGPLSNSWVGRAKEAARRFVRRDKQLPGYPLDANMFNPHSLTETLLAAGFARRDITWVTRTHNFGTVIATRADIAGAWKVPADRPTASAVG